MAAGCDFTCDNEKCLHYKKGIVVNGPWPLGDINKIISAKNVKLNKEFQKGLIELRNSGRKYSCIIYPNVNKIDVVGYRINLWCQDCKYLGQYDIMIEPYGQDTKTSEEIEDIVKKMIDESKINDNVCPTCKKKMKTFSQLMEQDSGIDCPYCKVKMTKNSFFSNETSKEYTINVG
jgi:hypothetical protein